MHAVTFSDSRLDGLTSDDSVTAFNFGTVTLKSTAGGHNWTTCLVSESGWDRPHYSPPASGHGHRP